mmetsp:Transcript_11674/g.37342  ORF Transcript_11674/g.37342 Transcript_11674/m.37342 type:complete len:103 (+) Transcript_11674:622-930(+)
MVVHSGSLGLSALWRHLHRARMHEQATPSTQATMAVEPTMTNHLMESPQTICSPPDFSADSARGATAVVVVRAGAAVGGRQNLHVVSHLPAMLHIGQNSVLH